MHELVIVVLAALIIIPAAWALMHARLEADRRRSEEASRIRRLAELRNRHGN